MPFFAVFVFAARHAYSNARQQPCHGAPWELNAKQQKEVRRELESSVQALLWISFDFMLWLCWNPECTSDYDMNIAVLCLQKSQQ
jgi:hypothetical protein